jgi:hypothetical protein
MKVLTTLVVSCILFATMSVAFAQTTTSSTSPTMAFGLLDGTPLKLRLGRTMSSKDAKDGETVDFEVLEDVKVGDVIVVARGGTALGTVTKAKSSGRMGRGGKLDITIDHVRLVDGEKVALRAVKGGAGGNHVGAMTGAIVATAILFFPAAPFFLFMKGKNITIPKGTEITAYVNGDSTLDARKFVMPHAPLTPSPVRLTPETLPETRVFYDEIVTPSATSTVGVRSMTGASEIQSAPESSAAPAISTIAIKSTPDGADIEVDGKYVGSTPSTVQLKTGDHKIAVKKKGFTTWQRTLILSPGGNIVVDASLEKEAPPAAPVTVAGPPSLSTAPLRPAPAR